MNVYYHDELINELSELCGILPEYWDIFGKKHITSIETKKAVLKAMKLKIDSVDDIVKEINERKWKSWKSFIEPVHVVSVNTQPVSIPICIPIRDGDEAKLMISWALEDETSTSYKDTKGNDDIHPFSPHYQGGRGGCSDKGIKKTEFSISGADLNISEQQWIDGVRYIKVNLNIESRDIGYYVLNIECKHPDKIFAGKSNKIQKRSKVIVTPDTCYIHPKLQNNPPSPPFTKGGEGGLFNGKAWGLSINLYAIRSENNWGIGDFANLKMIIRWIVDLKGSFVGINPLHAIPNTKPFGVSPYAPISRLYKNFIYLDIKNIPEVKESEDNRKVISSKKFNKELDKLRKEDTIDYEKVASLKGKLLRNAFELFYKKHFIRNTLRGIDFKKYIKEEGTALESFSLYMALKEHMKKTKNAYSWQEWHDKYHNASSKAVEAFKKEHKKEILFYQYIQWLVDGQLKEISEEAKDIGINIGLYYDLAIGSVGGGSDAWSYQDVIADGADVGAPPDDFSPDGQKWGFPPLIPEKLRDTGYELFIWTIRKNMKYGGAIRIDHALGLFRVFWIPDGMMPKDGAYITYPSEDLLRIIALESNRNKTIVIAEDLGTIGENVREMLKRFQMLSYRLFYFEKNYPDPSFLSPDKYPVMALCAVTTHDLPTLYGYWKGQDVEVRRKLGKYRDDIQWQQHMNDRERDKRLMLLALKSQGIIPDDYPAEPEKIPEMTPELCLAIYQYLARTPCKLLLVSLDDIIGNLNQQNMPGTVDSYPNWMQKTPVTLEEIIRDKRFADLAGMLKKIF